MALHIKMMKSYPCQCTLGIKSLISKSILFHFHNPILILREIVLVFQSM